jgi:hypothetical protein
MWVWVAPDVNNVPMWTCLVGCTRREQCPNSYLLVVTLEGAIKPLVVNHGLSLGPLNIFAHPLRTKKHTSLASFVNQLGEIWRASSALASLFLHLMALLGCIGW